MKENIPRDTNWYDGQFRNKEKKNSESSLVYMLLTWLHLITLLVVTLERERERRAFYFQGKKMQKGISFFLQIDSPLKH
jgi:hypothetical protein